MSIEAMLMPVVGSARFIFIALSVVLVVGCAPDPNRRTSGSGGPGTYWTPDGGIHGLGVADASSPGTPPPASPGGAPDHPPGASCGGEDVASACGPSGGACRPGWQWCEEGRWGSCSGTVDPATEACDGVDNDCNRDVDPSPCEAFSTGDETANEAQRAALGHINALRAALGVRLVRFHPLLNVAAMNHARYVQSHPGQGHAETNEQSPLFTGRAPADRARHAGYDGPMTLYENMAYGVGPVAAVNDWYNSVYHRVPLVLGHALTIGFGVAEGAEVLMVAGDGVGAGQLVLTPYDGQRAIPIDFQSDFEGPDPVPSAGLVGYPISVVSGGAAGFVSGEIEADGMEPYDLHIADVDAPHEGFLRGSFFMMAAQPMASGRWHTVRIQQAGGGAPLLWRFKTAD